MKRIARSAIVECSAGELYALVENIEAYPEFLPWCISTRVLERSPGRTRATLHIGMKGVKQSITTENRTRPSEAIDMQLVEGPFRHFSAAWRFAPLGERAAKIEFEMAWKIGAVAPARLLEPLFEHIANTMVDAFTRRARDVYGTNPG
jgi:ribosome-associated toxin RatA of RatAB toxin-antitoxin module